jgi:hypothetical protein
MLGVEQDGILGKLIFQPLALAVTSMQSASARNQILLRFFPSYSLYPNYLIFRNMFCSAC